MLAVTVAGGNVGLECTLPNALALVALAGSDVPVYAGADRPLLGAFVNETPSERDLICRERPRPPKAHATLLRLSPPRARALVDQRSLELGDAGEHRQYHPARRRGRIGPGLGERTQAGASILKLFGDFKEITRRAGQAIEPGDHDDVAVPHVVVSKCLRGSVAHRRKNRSVSGERCIRANGNDGRVSFVERRNGDRVRRAAAPSVAG